MDVSSGKYSYVETRASADTFTSKVLRLSDLTQGRRDVIKTYTVYSFWESSRLRVDTS